MQRRCARSPQQRNAVILAHNYQRPEVQDVADVVGDSLGLSRQAAATDADAIVFCGVHFMAETASILSPDKTVLIPDLDAGCSLSDSITADQLRAWKAQHPGAIVVMYVNTSAEVKAETDYCCTSSNAVKVVEHIFREHGDDTKVLFGPDMWLGAYVARETGRDAARSGTASATCTPASARRHQRAALERAGGRLPDPSRVRLHDAGDGVRRRRRRGGGGDALPLDRGHDAPRARLRAATR